MSVQSALDFIRATRAGGGAQGPDGDSPPSSLDQLLAHARRMQLPCSKSDLVEAHRIDWKMRAMRLQREKPPARDDGDPRPGETPGELQAPYQAAVKALYRDAYARRYASLWNEGWPRKNAENLQCVEDLLPAHGRWMDLCCGGGWHFGQVRKPCEKTGIDLSEAQLARARENNPDVTLIQDDVLEIPPTPDYDLVTCFWLSYGYLDDEGLIEQFCRRMTDWLKPGGNLVLEVADARAVHTWNESDRGRASSFRVIPRNDDGSRWAFLDAGGVHRLTTPDYAFFDRVLGPRFERHERRFRYNWCGIGRK